MIAIIATAGFVNDAGLDLVLSLVFYAIIVLGPMLAIGLGIHFVLSVPMRRRERARFFLDLLDTALTRGDSPERTLVDLAQGRDRSLGVRFHLLAAHLEEGHRLDAALEKVARLLPPSVAAILMAGQRFGNLRGVIPACRQVLADGQSSVRSAISYMVVLLLSLSPMAISVIWTIHIFILPKFNEIIPGMGINASFWFAFLYRHPFWVAAPPTLSFLALVAAACFYLGGPQVAAWFQFGGFPVSDRVAWRLPWKQHRLLRTFSVMLATLLDGGMPENEAVRLAADCTANEIVRGRAERVRAALARGEKLTDAIAALDDHGVLRWRLRNAVHGGAGNFLRALQGWHESLEATAFREEQTAADLTSSALVLMNGVVVAVIALAVFGTIVSIIEIGVLW